MADPATQFQPPGMQASGYSPSVVPSETRGIQLANYGPMMQAIEQAGQTILNSPLNPEVRSRMQLAAAGAQVGTKELQEWSNDPNQRWKLGMLGGISGGQFNLAPGYATPMATRALLSPPGGGAGNQVGPPNPSTVPPGDNPQQQQPQQQPPGQQQTPQQQPQGQSNGFGFKTSQADTSNPFAPPGQQPPMAAPGGQQVNPNLSASTDNDFLLRRNAQQQAGQQMADQVGQQALVQWQNNNQGGVMSAVQAKEWAQHNLDTDINRAVYLPQGGPTGQNGQKEPAFAFFGKKGGTNVVPISQMVKAGAGALVAAQNSSQVLNTADQANKAAQQVNQQQQGGSPTPMSAQMGQPQGPPAAPSAVPQTPGGQTDWGAMPGQLPQDEFNRRVAAATNVTNAGGPPTTSLTASAANGPNAATSTTDENGTPKAGHNDGTVNLSGNPNFVAQTTGLNNDQLNQMRNSYLKNGSSTFNPNSSDQSNPDPMIGKTGDFSWYMSNGGKGLAYAVKPGQVPFTESRLYEGSDHWEQFDPPEQALQRNLMQWDPSLSPAEIQGMSKQQMQARLQEQYYIQRILPSRGEMQPGTQANVDHLHDEILAATRVENAIKGMKPQQYGQTAQQGNTLARQAETLQSSDQHGPLGWWNNARAWVNGLISGQGQENPKVSFIQDQMKNLEGQVAGRADEEAPLKQLSATAGSTTFPTELHNWLNQRKLDYQRSVTGILANNQRIPGQYVDMANDMKVGKPWWDPADTYGPGSTLQPGNAAKAEHAQLANHGAPPAAPSPTPSPTPAMGTSQANPLKVNSAQQYNAVPKGTYYQDSTGRTFLKQ
jgi:hypothetical protein